MKKIFLSSLMLMACTSAFAVNQDHAKIMAAATAFVQQQTASQPGKVDFKIDQPDRRIALPECAQLEAFLPPGSTLIGKTSVGVRCSAPTGWSVFVPARISISLDLLTSARALPAGHLLQQQDITVQTTETTRPTGFTDPAQAVGKVLRYGIPAGQVLREDMLRLPYSARQGQSVQIAAQGNGFSIRSEGVAINNASEGQPVQVRVGARVIGGIARSGGLVEISP